MSDSFLLQYKDICALQNPSRHDLNSLREWLTRPECGDNFLEGVERDTFHAHDRLDEDQERASDLVTLSREAVEKDFFSRWMTDELLSRFHKFIGHRMKVWPPPTLSNSMPLSRWLTEKCRSLTMQKLVSTITESPICEPSLILSVSCSLQSSRQPPSSPCTTSRTWSTGWE